MRKKVREDLNSLVEVVVVVAAEVGFEKPDIRDPIPFAGVDYCCCYYYW